MDRRESADRIEPTLAAEAIEPTDRTEPTEATDSIEPAEPSERTEPAEPTDRIDAFDPMLRNESCEPIDHREPWLSLMRGILARARARGNARRRTGRRTIRLLASVFMFSVTAGPPSRRRCSWSPVCDLWSRDPGAYLAVLLPFLERIGPG